MRSSSSRCGDARARRAGAAALELAAGEETRACAGRHLRLRALDFGRVGRRVDGDQQVALLDQRAFAEVHRLHGAGDARADVDALDRFEAAGELVPGATSLCTTVATETGVAVGAAAACELFVFMLNTAVATAVSAVSVVPAIQSRALGAWGLGGHVTVLQTARFARRPATARPHPAGTAASGRKHFWDGALYFVVNATSMWQNVASSQGLVKQFINDHYEKKD